MIERQGIAAGQFRILGRLGVEQQAVDHPAQDGHLAQVVRLGHRHDGEYGQPGALADFGEAFGAGVGMDLQHIQLDRREQVIEESVAGLDHQPDATYAALGLRAQRGGGFKAQVAGGLFKEDKADVGRAAVDDGFQRFRGGDAADLGLTTRGKDQICAEHPVCNQPCRHQQHQQRRARGQQRGIGAEPA